MKRILVGGCAALLVMAGCADDPSIYLGGPPGATTRIQLSTGDLSIRVGDAVTVGAAALDAVGNVTGDVPSFSACSGAPVTVASATAENLYSGAATITGAASSAGAGCVNVTAGGVTDTIHVEVGPAGMVVTGSDTVGSGESSTYTVTGYTATGGAVTGAPPLEWTSSNTARMIVNATTGEVTGRSPGAVTIRARGPGGVNAVRTLTVAPGAFSGTLSANTGSAGAQITATTGANDDAFDATTIARFGGQDAYIEVLSPSQLLVALPATGTAGAQNLDMLNMGTGETARRVSVTAGSAFDDTFGAATDAPGTSPSFVANMSPGGYVYFTHSGFGTGSASRGAWNGGPQQDHYFRFTATASGTVTALLEWTNATSGGDFDLEICTLAGGGCAFWFSGSSTREQGTAYAITAGTTYTVMASAWTAANNIHNMRLLLTLGGGAAIN